MDANKNVFGAPHQLSHLARPSVPVVSSGDQLGE